MWQRQRSAYNRLTATADRIDRDAWRHIRQHTENDKTEIVRQSSEARSEALPAGHGHVAPQTGRLTGVLEASYAVREQAGAICCEYFR